MKQLGWMRGELVLLGGTSRLTSFSKFVAMAIRSPQHCSEQVIVMVNLIYSFLCLRKIFILGVNFCLRCSHSIGVDGIFNTSAIYRGNCRFTEMSLVAEQM